MGTSSLLDCQNSYEYKIKHFTSNPNNHQKPGSSHLTPHLAYHPHPFQTSQYVTQPNPNPNPPKQPLTAHTEILPPSVPRAFPTWKVSNPLHPTKYPPEASKQIAKYEVMSTVL